MFGPFPQVWGSQAKNFGFTEQRVVLISRQEKRMMNDKRLVWFIWELRFRERWKKTKKTRDRNGMNDEGDLGIGRVRDMGLTCKKLMRWALTCVS